MVHTGVWLVWSVRLICVYVGGGRWPLFCGVYIERRGFVVCVARGAVSHILFLRREARVERS